MQNTAPNLISCGFLPICDQMPFGTRRGLLTGQVHIRERGNCEPKYDACGVRQSCGYQQRQEYNEVSITFMHQGAEVVIKQMSINPMNFAF